MILTIAYQRTTFFAWIKRLFIALVYHGPEEGRGAKLESQIVLNDLGDNPSRNLEPQLAGLLAILSSDILFAMGEPDKDICIKLEPGTGCQHVEFRFARTVDRDQGYSILSSVARSKLASGVDPDIRIELLETESEQGAGIRLTFQTV